MTSMRPKMAWSGLCLPRPGKRRPQLPHAAGEPCSRNWMSSGGSDHLPGGLPPDDSDDDRIVGHRLLDKVLLVVELRRDLEVHTEHFFILVMRKAETVRRLEHQDRKSTRLKSSN